MSTTLTVTIPPVAGPRTRPPARPVAAPASRGAYLRRRLAVGVVGAVLVLVTARAGVALGSASLAAPERHPASRVVAVPSVTVVVRPGDSLWAIARRVAPDEDPRVVVDELEQARHDAPLVPGESITWTG